MSFTDDVFSRVSLASIAIGVTEIPDWVLSSAGKMGAALLLAMIAELGRRVVGALWERKRK